MDDSCAGLGEERLVVVDLSFHDLAVRVYGIWYMVGIW